MSSDLEPGRMLSHYRLAGKIGAGGMGVVWRALDTKLGRDVALKLLPAPLAGDPVRLALLEREARTVAALNHPNIVTIHSVEQVGDVRFLTMELVDGEPLTRGIPPGGTPIAELLDLAVPLADALCAAHEKGVVHRDLKPGNIVIGPGRRPKILDFGLAKLRQPSSSAPSPHTDLPTQTAAVPGGQVLGTAPYMAPEQLQGRPADPRSDIFSFGVVLYEMATGRRPFEGETQADLISSILRDTPPPLAQGGDAARSELQRIILHCLEKDPARRPQTAMQTRDALEALRGKVRSGAVGPSGPAATPSGPRSIAILPLADLSATPGEEYFADGMTEALINDLARIAALKVSSRTAVMPYKGTRKPLREIARELGVGALMEGSVLRAGGRVRITARLIDASTERHLWAESYDRDLQDVLALQSEVARAIANGVRVTLTPQEQIGLTRARPVDPESHEAYLKGRYFWNRRTGASMRRAVEYFNLAIEKDPTCALAYVGLADAYDILGFYGYLAPEDAFPRARAAAREALALDDTLAEARVSLGYVHLYYEWDWAASETAFLEAIRARPAYAVAHHWYANLLVAMGRLDEALAEALKARELDPLSLIISTFVGWVLLMRREYDRCVAEVRKALEMDPSFAYGRLWLGWASLHQGAHARALEELAEGVRLTGESVMSRGMLAHAQAVTGDTAAARAALQRLMSEPAGVHVPAHLIGVIHLALGETDRAIEWLERGVEQRNNWMVMLRVDPRFDPIRQDPRFEAICRKVGLPAVSAPGR